MHYILCKKIKRCLFTIVHFRGFTIVIHYSTSLLRLIFRLLCCFLSSLIKLNFNISTFWGAPIFSGGPYFRGGGPEAEPLLPPCRAGPDQISIYDRQCLDLSYKSKFHPSCYSDRNRFRLYRIFSEYGGKNGAQVVEFQMQSFCAPPRRQAIREWQVGASE